MTPAAGLLLVKPVETEDTIAGGVIIHVAETKERLTANQCEVIAVGAPKLCDTEDCERMHVCAECDTPHFCDTDGVLRMHPTPAYRAGDWLLVRPRCYIPGPVPERAEWFIAQDDVLAILTED